MSVWSKAQGDVGTVYECEICHRRAVEEPGAFTGQKRFRTASARELADHLLTYRHRARTKPLYGDFVPTPPAEPDVIDEKDCDELVTAALAEMRIPLRTMHWAQERLSDIGEHTRWQRARLAEAIETAMQRWLGEEGLGPPVPGADD